MLLQQNVLSILLVTILLVLLVYVYILLSFSVILSAMSLLMVLFLAVMVQIYQWQTGRFLSGPNKCFLGVANKTLEQVHTDTWISLLRHHHDLKFLVFLYCEPSASLNVSLGHILTPVDTWGIQTLRGLSFCTAARRKCSCMLKNYRMTNLKRPISDWPVIIIVSNQSDLVIRNWVVYQEMIHSSQPKSVTQMTS